MQFAAFMTTPTRLPPVASRGARLVLAGLAAATVAWPAQAQLGDAPMPGDYQVVDGRVDRGTYTGWRLFHTSCHGCHGIGAVGTDVAPNLLQRIPNLTPRGFASRVLTSYRIVRMSPDNGAADREAEREALLEQVMRRERTARGQPVMPAWEKDESITPHVLDLYAYLSARADGAIGPGKPRVAQTKKKR